MSQSGSHGRSAAGSPATTGPAAGTAAAWQRAWRDGGVAGWTPGPRRRPAARPGPCWPDRTAAGPGRPAWAAVGAPDFVAHHDAEGADFLQHLGRQVALDRLARASASRASGVSSMMYWTPPSGRGCQPNWMPNSVAAMKNAHGTHKNASRGCCWNKIAPIIYMLACSGGCRKAGVR